MRITTLIAAAALSASTFGAHADVLRVFDISASNFVLESGPGGEPPIEPVIAFVDIVFDPSADIAATTAGLNFASKNLPSATKYAYNLSKDALILGTDPSPVACGGGAGSWCAFILGAANSASPTVSIFSVTSANGGIWDAQTITLSRIAASPAPEPSTWALLLIGFAGLGYAGCRKARAAA